MSALVTDEALCKLDGVDTPNYRRACRPFSTNAGFVIAEAAQFAILMSDDLALALGAPILGAVGDVFVMLMETKNRLPVLVLVTM